MAASVEDRVVLADIIRYKNGEMFGEGKILSRQNVFEKLKRDFISNRQFSKYLFYQHFLYSLHKTILMRFC